MEIPNKIARRLYIPSFVSTASELDVSLCNVDTVVSRKPVKSLQNVN